jgi:hypothetical protein
VTYEFDVFLSYTRRGGARSWVQENFYPALRDCLDNAMLTAPKIFVDWEMESGVYWPDELESALKCSRLMVSVVSPPYFRSPWCMAEWQTIWARQEKIIAAGGKRPRLLHPVRFADGKLFPREVLNISYQDFKEWNAPMAADSFRAVPAYRDFYRAVEDFAEILAGQLSVVPDWDPTWPIIRPDPPDDPPAQLPRL